MAAASSRPLSPTRCRYAVARSFPRAVGATATLGRELLAPRRLSEQTQGLAFPDLYAVAYRTFTADRKGQLQVWEEALAVGRALPTLPLWITPDVVVPVDLESSYRETCEGLRIRM